MDQTLRQLGELALGAIPTVFLFVLVWTLYRTIVHKALSAALVERRSRTVGAFEKAKQDIAAAERKASEYEAKVNEARMTVFKAQESRRQKILEQKTMAVAEARAAAQTRVTMARAEIQKETEIAKALIQAESSTLAQDIVRAILRVGTTAKQPAVGGRR